MPTTTTVVRMTTLVFRISLLKNAADAGGSGEEGFKKRSQDDNFLTWLLTRPHSVAWNNLGFDDDVAPDGKNFVPACAFFFFIPDLPV